MTFDQAVDQLKRDIRAERFFDSLAERPKPVKYEESGFGWGVIGFWLFIGWLAYTYC
jgi:hypothetical protein